MRTGRRLLALFLACLMLFSTVPVQTFATGDETGIEIIIDETEPEVTESPATEPPATEPPVTEPPVTDPPVTEPPATEPPVTEPPATEPPVTEPPVTEPPATEPPATEPTATEPENVSAEAVFSVIWDSLGFSGKAPDVSGDIIVTDASGATVKNADITLKDGCYIVSGLLSTESYTLHLQPGSNGGYMLTGADQIVLTYNDSIQQFVVSDTFSAKLKTYDLVFEIVMPEGMELSQDFESTLYYKGKALRISAEDLGEGRYQYSDLYVLDGDYTLSVAELKDLTVNGGYEIRFNSKTGQPLTVVYEQIMPTAEFVIYWKDHSDAAGRRVRQAMEDMVRVHISKDGNVSQNALSGLDISEKLQKESELNGYEKVLYTVHNVPYGMDDSVELVLKWDDEALLDYRGYTKKSESIAYQFDDITLTKDENTGIYFSEKAYAFELPEYELELKINGLPTDMLEQFISNIRITVQDLETGADIPYTGFTVEQTADGLKFRNLFESYIFSYGLDTAVYSISWPKSVGNFNLDEQQMDQITVGGNVAVFAANTRNGGATVVELNYHERVPSYDANGTASRVKEIIWYDPDDDYSHQGDLSLSVDVTINNVTKTFTVSWDETAGKYTHTWTLDDLKLFDLPNEEFSEEELTQLVNKLAPLTVTDEGENNLNRRLIARTSAEMVVSYTQYNVTETKKMPIAVSAVNVTGVSYTPAEDANIRSYEMGSDNAGNLIMYPMVDVSFETVFRNGGEEMNAEDVRTILSKVILTNAIDKNNPVPVKAQDIIRDYHFQNTSYKIMDENGTLPLSDTTVTVRVPLYDTNKRQIDYAIQFADNSKEIRLEGNNDYYYRVEHDNTRSPGHGTDINRTYAKGQLILIRTGDTDFAFHKQWTDKGDAETAQKRPQTTYTLWRYSINGGDYTTAAMVEFDFDGDGDKELSGTIPTGYSEKDGVVTVTNTLHFVLPVESNQSDDTPEYLEKYDSEGYPYVYFVRESMANSEYEKIYGKAEIRNGVPYIVPNTLPLGYMGMVQKEDDRSIYDEGWITNRKKDTVDQTVVKNWVAAYYQDSFEDSSVELRLMSIHADPAHGTTPQLVQTVHMDAFDAYNPSQTHTINVPKYDVQGHELVYWWEEVSVQQDGEAPVNVGAKVGEDGSAIFELPLNHANIALGGSSADSDEWFHASAEVNEGVTTFTNKLEGTTQYWVKKSWDSDMKRQDVSFILYQMGEDGTLTVYKDENNNHKVYQLPADSKLYTGTTGDNGENGGTTAFHVPDVFKDLPMYDEDGNLYNYIVKEANSAQMFPLYSYNQDADGDKKREPNSVAIHNSIGDDDTIKVRKIWLDDSATTGRDKVYFNIYTTDGVLLYGTHENGDNGVLGAAVEVDDSFNWMKEVTVTAYYKSVTDDAGQTTTTWKTAPVEGELDWVRYNSQNGYYIQEVKVGTNSVRTGDADKTAAGYTTVVNKGTKYAVIYEKDNVQSPLYTNTTDEDGFYVVTNLRIGTTDLEIKKIWQDNDEKLREKFNASVTLICENDEDRIQTGNGSEGVQATDTDNAYAKVHTAVNTAGLVPITTKPAADGGDPVKVTIIQQLQKTDSSVYYYNLPMYDEMGKILRYSVNESITPVEVTQNSNFGYVANKSSVSYSPATNNAGSNTGIQTITNTFQETASITFYLLWLDQYRIEHNQRPDMYLKLYYKEYQYDDQGNPVMVDGKYSYVVKSHGFHEYLWDPERNEKITEDFWSYTFDGLRKYDDYGNEITYYATLSTHVNESSFDYLKAQYSEGYVDSFTEFIMEGVNKATVEKNTANNEYTVTNNIDNRVVESGQDSSTATPVMAQSNTFVIQLKNDVTVEGHKVWEKVPDGFPAGDLPRLNFKLKRSQPSHKDELDTLIGGDFFGAAILNHESPDRNFSFEMCYIGINSYDSNTGICTLVDKNADVTYYVQDDDYYGEPRTVKASEAWLHMAGLSNASDDTKNKALNYYGQLMPKYNSKGELYTYTVVETFIIPDKDSYISNRVEINNSVNEYNITNSIRTDKRLIEVTKDWLRNSVEMTAVQKEKFLYPELEFVLYRTCLLNEPVEINGVTHTYMPLTQVGDSVKLTSAQVKAIAEGAKIYATFNTTQDGEKDASDRDVPRGVEIYAPNGNPFIYVVGEKKIEGYNNKEGENYPNFTVDRVNSVSNVPVTVPNNNYWWTNFFTVDVYETVEGTQKPALNTQVALGDLTNNYTALEQKDIVGSKVWEDYEDSFNTRPETLTLVLYRSVSHGGSTFSEKVADITLYKDGRTPTITEVSPSVNITSAYKQNIITIDGTGTNTRTWGFKVYNLDLYASNGKEWNYSIAEEAHRIPEGYTSNQNGMTITNTLHTHAEVIKYWKDEEDSVVNGKQLYPKVRVELQVSDNGGTTWADADDVFGNRLGADYVYVKDLEEPHWRDIFWKLPIGTGEGEDDYKPYTYRVRETHVWDSIGEKWVAVTYDENGTGSFGNGMFTVTATTSADGKQSLITNSSDNTQFTVKKVWVDDFNNGYSTRPADNWTVKFHVYRSITGKAENGQKLMMADGVTPVVLTVSGSKNDTEGTDTITDLPSHSPEGLAYTYYARELDTDGEEIENNRYNGAYNVTQEDTTDTDGHLSVITNKLILTSINVTKKWNGEGENDFRPDSIDLTLRRSGDTDANPFENTYVTVQETEPDWTTGQNSWIATYRNLPKFDKDGNLYTYTVIESQQSGYQKPLYVYGEQDSTFADNTTTAEITNIATEFYLTKVNEDGDELHDVKLEFEGTGSVEAFTLTWWRNSDDHIEHYTIKKAGEPWSGGSGTEADNKVPIIGLPEGTYQLLDETTIPSGYYASALGGQFTLSSTYNDGKTAVIQSLSGTENKLTVDNNTVTLKAVDKKTTLTVEKLGVDNETVENGWEFAISGIFHGETEEKEYPYPGTDFTGKLVVGNVYTMRETVNPDGYILRDDAVVQFKLDKNNNVVIEDDAGAASSDGNTLKFTDLPFEISITKHLDNGNSVGKSLNGAHFLLKDAAGNAISTNQSLVSDDDGVVTLKSIEKVGETYSAIFKTSQNEAGATWYKLEEAVAPDGYAVPDTHPYITFWFDSNGVAHYGNSHLIHENTKFVDEPIELILTKYDGGDRFAPKQILSNVVFDIAEYAVNADGTMGSATNRTGTVTTDTNGKIEFGPEINTPKPAPNFTNEKIHDFMLIGGRYYTLTEQTVPGYEQVNAFTFKVETDGDIIFTNNENVKLDTSGMEVVNDRHTGTVLLKKFGMINGTKYDLNGAEFKLYREDTPENLWEKLKQLATGTEYQLIWSTTDSAIDKKVTGTISGSQLKITNLPWGTYKLKETKAPAGFQLSNREITFHITAEQLNAVITIDGDNGFKNEAFTATFYKHANIGGFAGKVLSGAEFELQEQNASNNWVKVNTTQNLVSNSDGKVVISSVESVNGQLKVILNTSENSSNAIKYRLVEIKAPNGYILPDTAPYVEFWFNAEGQIQYTGNKHNVVSVNKFLDSPILLKLVKFDGGDLFAAKTTLSNVTFTITEYDADGKTTGRTGTVTTDSNGLIEFKPESEEHFMVIGGMRYKLQETQVNGYRKLADFTFTVNENGTITFENTTDVTLKSATELEAVNRRIPGTVKLYKVGAFSNTNFNLNDAEFSLYRQATASSWLEALQNFLTGKKYDLVWNSADKSLSKTDGEVNEKGELKITNLPWGTYKLVETKSPAGFKLESREFVFTIGPDNPEEMIYLDQGSEEVVNNPFSFSFSKHLKDGSGAGKALEGAGFKLQEKVNGKWEDITTSQCLISGEDGSVTVSSVEPDGDDLKPILKADGTQYRLEETKAPDGYILPDAHPFVEFHFETDGALVIDSRSDVTAAMEFLDAPIELTLVKFDGGDRISKQVELANVSFAISEYNADGEATGRTGTIVTDEHGQVQFKPDSEEHFMVIGGMYYKLEETQVNGYEKLPVITFEVKTNGTIGTITVEADKTADATASSENKQLDLVNERILGTVRLTKTTLTNDLVNGVVFKLYHLEKPDSLLEKFVDFITGKTYTLDATFKWDGTTSEDFKYTLDTDEDGNPVITDGVLTIKGLDWGEYKLVETAAEGYILPKDAEERSYYFEIGPDNADQTIVLNKELVVTNTPNRVMVQKQDQQGNILSEAYLNENREGLGLKGAIYKLYRNVPNASNGTDLVEITNSTNPLQAMWIWNQATGTGEASCLPAGDYTLVEFRAPDGYVVAAPIVFHMDQHGVVTVDGRECETQNNIPLIEAIDTETFFYFTKHELIHESCASNAKDTRILAGVEFTAYLDAECTLEIATAVSDTNGVVMFTGLPLKTYKGETPAPVYIKETATVAGHVLDTNTYVAYINCYLNATGSRVDGTTLLVLKNGVETAVPRDIVINDVFRANFGFTKVSELDNLVAIPGAVYGLYKTVNTDILGVVVPFEAKIATATADANGFVVFDGLLMDVEYTIKEISVPAGSYLSKNSIRFKYTWDGTKAVLTILDDGNGTITRATEKDIYTELLWQEPQVVVSILKTDSSGRPLAGAKLQLRDFDGDIVPVLDASGKPVNSWISTKEPFVIAGQLEAGKTYWLCELEAPKGFVKARWKKIQIPEESVEPGEELVIKVSLKNYRPSDNPKTGDNMSLQLWLCAMITSAAGLISMLFFGRKRRRDAWRDSHNFYN